jgi:hypothetical protein
MEATHMQMLHDSVWINARKCNADLDVIKHGDGEDLVEFNEKFEGAVSMTEKF